MNLKRRIERLERQSPGNRGQLVYITNLGPDDEEETPWDVKLSPDTWAFAFGRAFTAEEIERLRAEYAEGKP